METVFIENLFLHKVNTNTNTNISIHFIGFSDYWFFFNIEDFSKRHLFGGRYSKNPLKNPQY